MFSGILQPTHLILILAIVLIIFGPGKLPELGKTIGSGIREFRNSVNTLTEETNHPVATTPVVPAPEAPAVAQVAPAATRRENGTY